MNTSISKYIAYFLIMLMLVGNTGLSITTVLCACHGKVVYAASKAKKACCKHDEIVTNPSENLFIDADLASILNQNLGKEKPNKTCHNAHHQAPLANSLSSNILSSMHKCCNQQVEYIHIDKAQEFKYSPIISCECENSHHHDLDCTCCNLKFLAWNYQPIYYAPAHPIWQLQPFDFNNLAQAPPLPSAGNIGRFIIHKIENYRC